MLLSINTTVIKRNRVSYLQNKSTPKQGLIRCYKVWTSTLILTAYLPLAPSRDTRDSTGLSYFPNGKLGEYQ